VLPHIAPKWTVPLRVDRFYLPSSSVYENVSAHVPERNETWDALDKAVYAVGCGLCLISSRLGDIQLCQLDCRVESFRHASSSTMISLRARARPPLWHLPPRPRRPLRRNAHTGTDTSTSPTPSSKEPKTHYARGEAISVNTLIASFATLLVGMAGGGVGAAVWVRERDAVS